MLPISQEQSEIPDTDASVTPIHNNLTLHPPPTPSHPATQLSMRLVCA